MGASLRKVVLRYGQLVALQSGKPPVEVPLAFQSAMAGVLLGAELVSDLGGLRSAELPTKTVLDLTRPLASRLNTNVKKQANPSGARCICQDADYVEAYREAHGLEKGSKRAKKTKIATTNSSVPS